MVMENTQIHKTAIIDPCAKLGDGVSIGPYTVVGPNVMIDDNVKIASHCVLEGKTTVGAGTQLYSGAVIGSDPQDKKHKSTDDVELIIGENNVIREFVTINPGTVEGGAKTVLGDNNLLMAYSHVAHDCVIGNNCVMANSGTLAGHVTLEDNAVVGGLSAVHQFVRLGRLAIVGGCSKVVQDIPPFSMCDGHPAKVFNINIIGLKRAAISLEVVKNLKRAFKILFHSGLSKTHAIEKIENEISSSPEIDHLIFFAKTTKRGLCS
jgi:UDP-N-acetylglucosamine acyltransferase